MTPLLYDIATADVDTAFTAARASGEFVFIDLHSTTLSAQEIIGKLKHAQPDFSMHKDLVMPLGMAVGVECVLHAMHRRSGAQSLVACGVVVGLQFDPLSKDMNQSKRTLCNSQLALAVGARQRMFVDDLMQKPLKALLVGVPNEYTVTDAADVEVEVVTGGVLLVPVKDFLRRWRPLSREAAASRTEAHLSTAAQLKVVCKRAGFLGGPALAAAAPAHPRPAAAHQWLAPKYTPPAPRERISSCVLRPSASPPPAAASVAAPAPPPAGSIFAQVNAKATLLQAATKGWIGRRIVAELREAALRATLEAAASMIATQWRASAVARSERARLEAAAGERAVDEMMALLSDILPDMPDVARVWSECAQSHAAPQWQSVRLNLRDTAMKEEAMSYARSNPGIANVLLLADSERVNGVYLEKLPFPTLDATIPLGKPIKAVGRAQWNDARVSRAQLNDFVLSCGLYKHGVPFNAQARGYHTLYAFSTEDDDVIVGCITIKLATITSLVSAHGTMPLVYVALVATDPTLHGRGLGTALYNTALNAGFENGRRTGAAYVLAEAVQSGAGWQWWKKRVLAKHAVAVILAIQMIVVVDGNHALCRGALPCGDLLLPL